VAEQQGLRAVAVEQIPADLLDWNAVRAGLNLDRLPTVQLDDPEDPNHKSAALSWRWDRPLYQGRSRNVALALLHARRYGIRHVFFDCVSVKQGQPTELVLRDVAALSRLYSRIPVIAAYDQENDDQGQWELTLQRPWILYEIRSYSTNPTNVTHVGFWCEPREHGFEDRIWFYKHRGFSNVVMEIMHGRVEMTSIADFRFILPPFAKIFSAAANALNRADYLLAVFLLTAADEYSQSVEREGREVDYGHRLDRADPGLKDLGLERFSAAPSDGARGRYETATDISFDGRKVAIFRSKMTSSFAFDRVWIKALPSLAEVIFESLGFGPEEFAEFNRRREDRRAALYVDRTREMPDVSEVIARIPDGTWSTEIPTPRLTSGGFTPKR
jgi:hypothetical protein